MYPDTAPKRKGDWQAQAHAFGLPVFPILLTPGPDGKVRKVPLTRHGHKDASVRTSIFGELWSRANGFGIPMGQVAAGVGLYTFDLDLHRAPGDPMLKWLRDHGVPLETRIHTTPGGGLHFIYALPGKHLRLPSRANIVDGLDSRGQGGWIAFGEGYELLGEGWPALLPSEACTAVMAGYSGGGLVGDVEVRLDDYRPPDAAAAASLEARIARILSKNRTLLARWHAVKAKGDASRSARDHSVAFLLALHGLDENQIAHALMTIFEHGACRDPSVPEHTRIRAALRSGTKAREHVKALRRALRSDPSAQVDGAHEAFLATLSTTKSPE